MQDLSDHRSRDDMRAQFLAYLSAELPEQERAQFEERLLAEQSFSDRAAEVEYELLDDLAAGRLNATDSLAVRNWIDANPGRKLRLQTAVLLQQQQIYKQATRGRSRTWMPAGLALIAASLAIFAILLTGRHRIEKTPAKLATTSPVAVAPPDTILLVAARLRGPAPAGQLYPVHRGAPLRLQLLLPDHSPDSAFNLKVDSVPGTTSPVALRRNDLQVTATGRMRYVEVVLPPNSLPPSHYIAVLRGESGDLATSFSVEWSSRH